MCRRKGQPLVALLMADSRHSLWDDTGQRHLLFRHSEGRRSAMYLLPSAVNLIYALQQGYDFVHFQVSFFLPQQACRQRCNLPIYGRLSDCSLSAKIGPQP